MLNMEEAKASSSFRYFHSTIIHIKYQVDQCKYYQSIIAAITELYKISSNNTLVDALVP